MKNIFINIVRPSKVASVTFYYKNQQDFVCSLCIMERKKGVLSMKEKHAGITEISDLFEYIPKSLPVIVSFIGKVVLNKEYVNSEETDRSSFIPHNQEHDFYSYEFPGDQLLGVSICRKNIIDNILVQFKEKDFSVVSCLIGPYPAVSFWNFQLVSQDNYIPVLGGVLKFDANTGGFHFVQAAKEKENEKFLAGDEPVESNYSMAYINGLLWLLGSLPENFTEDFPTDIINGYQYKYLINKTKYVILGLCFLILILNFSRYETLRKKDSAVSAELAMNADVISKRDSLDNELKAKEEFLKYIGENKTFYSYYLDEIAGTVPDRVVLEDVSVNPLVNKIQKNEPVQIEKKINISGLCSNSLILNKWNKQLAGFRWIKSSEVINFAKTEDNKMGEFLIEIKLNQ